MSMILKQTKDQIYKDIRLYYTGKSVGFNLYKTKEFKVKDSNEMYIADFIYQRFPFIFSQNEILNRGIFSGEIFFRKKFFR